MQSISKSTAASYSVAIDVAGVGKAVEINADSARVPASSQKLLIASAALSAFGSEFRFATEARTSAAVDATGAIDELVVRVSGDPTLSSAQLKTLASAVYASGVRSIRVGLVLDSRTDSVARVSLWKPSFTPGEVGFLDGFMVDGNHRNDKQMSVDAGLANLGKLRSALVANKITVGTSLRRATLPDGGPTVGSVRSDPLKAIVSKMLKDSDNTYAEILAKDLGARTGVGSTASGIDAIWHYLESLGVQRPTVQVDASGISALNRLSARVEVDLLQKVATSPYGGALFDALPIACKDGTLKGRMCAPSTSGRVQAKTGTIDFVNTLAGYTMTANGKKVTFSILFNDTKSTSSARAAIDAIVTSAASANL